MRHVLVTNDFPPKVGGIQSYLWELWQRLPPDDVVVLTSPYEGAAQWDDRQAFRVVRAREPVLLPHPGLVGKARKLAAECGAKAFVVDPAVPLGALGPSLGLPYALVLHGAEVTVPGRLPGSRQLLNRSLRGSSLLIAAGSYAEAEARRSMGQPWPPPSEHEPSPPAVQVPPGVDVSRFRPLPAIERASARAHFGLPRTGPLVVSVSRLVPRKGMDTLIEAASSLSTRLPGLSVAIAGEGRDRRRLERAAAEAAVPVRFVGKLPDRDLPAFYACADVFALCCRSRWWGLEQEGFGIVLLEAAATGVPCVTVGSGGAAEAVVDGETGIVVPSSEESAWRPSSRAGHAEGVGLALAALLEAPERARAMGAAGRSRAERQFDYDILASRLGNALRTMCELGARPPVSQVPPRRRA